MATKPNMHFIATTSDKLDSIKIKAGQLIFVSDTRVIYLDTDKRTTYQAIMNIVDDETRSNMESPLEGYYYIRKSNALWCYFNNKWTQITGKDSSIIFADEGLPEEGEINKIYIDDTMLYRWNENTQEYDLITSKIDWEDLA